MIDHIFPDPTPKENRTAIIDFDIVINQAARYGADHNESPYDVFDRITHVINEWRTGARCTRQILCVSCSRADNYRRDYLPEYKAHRDKEPDEAERKRREMLTLAHTWASENLKLVRRPRLEADDLLGLLSKEDRVMVTIDKDLRTVPGWHYNPDKDDFPVRVTEAEADRLLIRQWLTGDSTDNIKGCPAIGPKKADKFLDETPREGWVSGVFALYEARDMDREAALSMWHAVKILRPGEYWGGQFQLRTPDLMFPSIENHIPKE